MAKKKTTVEKLAREKALRGKRATKATPKVSPLDTNARRVFTPQEALDNLEAGWYHQFRSRCIQPKEFSGRMVEWIVKTTKLAYPHGHTLRAAKLRAIANDIEAEGPAIGYGVNQCQQVTSQLRTAADGVHEDLAPWSDVEDQDAFTSQQRRILTVLWANNPEQASSWKLPLTVFLNGVWGDDIVHRKTVASAVSRLTKRLSALGINCNISVSLKRPDPHVLCTFFPKP